MWNCVRFQIDSSTNEEVKYLIKNGFSSRIMAGAGARKEHKKQPTRSYLTAQGAPFNILGWTKMEKHRKKNVCVTESLHCIAEINTVLLIHKIQ